MLNLLLKMLIVEAIEFEVVESVFNLLITMLKLLIVVDVTESVVIEAVDC